jgi:hypothetical protein
MEEELRREWPFCVTLLSARVSYILDGVGKHHLLGVISQVWWLFCLMPEGGHNFKVFTMRRIVLWLDIQKDPGV